MIFPYKLSLQKYERSETTMLDRWSITVSDVDPDPIRRAASSDGLEVKAAPQFNINSENSSKILISLLRMHRDKNL